MQRAVILCSGRQLTPKQLVLDDTQLSKPGVIQVGRTFSEMEREFILETLKRASGNRTQAAKILGLSVRTIRNKLREYRVEI